jgi:hypothetical protein
MSSDSDSVRRRRLPDSGGAAGRSDGAPPGRLGPDQSRPVGPEPSLQSPAGQTVTAMIRPESIGPGVTVEEDDREPQADINFHERSLPGPTGSGVQLTPGPPNAQDETETQSGPASWTVRLRRAGPCYDARYGSSGAGRRAGCRP